jgi:hypothetical protein
MKKFLLIAFSLALMAAPAWGASAPIFPGSVRVTVTTFVQGTDTAGVYKTIFTGGASGSKVIGIYITNTDGTASHHMIAQYSNSTTDHCATATTCGGGQQTTPDLNAGFVIDTGANDVIDEWNGLPQDSDGNKFIYVTDNTDTLEMTFETALTASTKISVVVMAVDF